MSYVSNTAGFGTSGDIARSQIEVRFLAHGTSTVGPLLLPLLLTEQIAHLRPFPIVFAWVIAREAKTPQTRHAASASPGTMLSSAQINGHIGHVG